jgi:hypothetical protein
MRDRVQDLAGDPEQPLPLNLQQDGVPRPMKPGLERGLPPGLAALLVDGHQGGLPAPGDKPLEDHQVALDREAAGVPVVRLVLLLFEPFLVLGPAPDLLAVLGGKAPDLAVAAARVDPVRQGDGIMTIKATTACGKRV